MGLHELHDVHALDDLTEYGVLAVQPRGDHGGDEELGSLGVGASVSHGEKSGLGVLDLEVLVVELTAVDGLAAHTVSVSEVTTLKHEVRDDSVEARSLVVEGFARGSNALLASTESTEVLGGLGNGLTEKTEQDAASRLVINLDVEEDLAGNLLKVSTKGGGYNHQKDEKLEDLHSYVGMGMSRSGQELQITPEMEPSIFLLCFRR